MMTEREIDRRIKLLDDFAMAYETAVLALPAKGYLEEFYRFFEIKSRKQVLIPAMAGFHEALREVSGDSVWQPIADQTERLFGLPKRVTIFENDADLRAELEGPDGLGPFFFIFDLMFCEYDDVTLCFISGTNN